MAEQPATGGGLSQKFMAAAKWVRHHLFSPTMIFMMVAMALPGVAVAASAVQGGATIGDLGLAVFDHYKMMFTAPFTEASTLGDVFTNTVNGNLAAGSYELGAHAAHGAHGAHGAVSSCTPFTEWKAGLDSQSLEAMNSAASIGGVSLEQHYASLCKG